MSKAELAATGRSVALYAGGALALSLLVLWGASRFVPTPTQPSSANVEEAVAVPAESTAPPPNQPSATVSVAFDAPPKPAPAPTDEASLMAELRQIKRSDPKGALELAREGNRRFPDSADAAERASIVVHALADLGSPSEARGEAEDMVNRYPDGDWVREVERFTGAHRHRNARLNSEGKLEFY